MRNRKRMLSLILAGVMGMSTLLAGCGTTDAGTGDAAVDTAVDTADVTADTAQKTMGKRQPLPTGTFFRKAMRLNRFMTN